MGLRGYFLLYMVQAMEISIMTYIHLQPHLEEKIETVGDTWSSLIDDANYSFSN